MYNIFKSYGLDDNIDKIHKDNKTLNESFDCDSDIEKINLEIEDACENYAPAHNRSKEEFFDTGFNDAFGISDIDDTQSLVDRGEGESLFEAYGNFPSWLLSRIHQIKPHLLKRNVDLANATFTEAPIPLSSRDHLMSTNGRIPVVLLVDRYQNFDLWLPGINDKDISWNRDDGTYASNLTYVKKSELMSHAKKFGYIDTTDSANMNTDIRRERALLNRNPNRRFPEKGQKPVRRNVIYGKKPNGFNDYDNILSYDIEWVTDRGYDKSGYKLDPQKYKKMLDDVGLDTYAQRLQKYHDQIEDLRLRLIAQLTRFDIKTSLDFKTLADSGFSNNIFYTIGSGIKQLSDAIYQYTQIENEINRWLRKDPSYWQERDNLSLDEAIRGCFEWRGKQVRDEIAELKNIVEAIEHATQRTSDEA